MALGEITVAIESVIHDTIAKVVQAIQDEHGIMVNAIRIDWLDVSSAGLCAFRVSSISIDSTTKVST